MVWLATCGVGSNISFDTDSTWVEGIQPIFDDS